MTLRVLKNLVSTSSILLYCTSLLMKITKVRDTFTSFFLHSCKWEFRVAGILLLHCLFYLEPINREYKLLKLTPKLFPDFGMPLLTGAASLLQISVLVELLLWTFMAHRGTTIFYEAMLCLIAIVYSLSEVRVEVYRHVKCSSLTLACLNISTSARKEMRQQYETSNVVDMRHIAIKYFLPLCQVSNYEMLYFTFIIGANIVTTNLFAVFEVSLLSSRRSSIP